MTSPYFCKAIVFLRKIQLIVNTPDVQILQKLNLKSLGVENDILVNLA